MAESFETINVTTEEEFIQFLGKIDDYEFVNKTLANAKAITVSFKIEGANYHSSLTGSMITALADYQKRIYHIYKVQKYGPKSTKSLTDEEMRALEIKVDIKPGCTEAIISFIKDIIPEVLGKMTGEEIIRTAIIVTGIVAGAWAIKGIASQLIKEGFKTKRAEIDSKIENAKTEKEKVFLESMKSVTHDAIEGMRSVANGLRVANPEAITVDGKALPAPAVIAIPEEMAVPKLKIEDTEPDLYTVEGDFQVLEINYQQSVTEMTAKDIKTQIVYEKINLLDGWLTEENMDLLKNAEERDPVHFRMVVQKGSRNKRIYTIDVNSIKKVNKEV